MVNGEISHMPFLIGKFLKAIWAKGVVLRPKLSEQKIRFEKGDRSQTLLVRRECHSAYLIRRKSRQSLDSL